MRLSSIVVSVAVCVGLMALPAPAQSAFPGENGKVVFRSNRDGNPEIYTMNADGSGVRRLTNNPASDLDPVWSPDGTKIAFESNRDSNPGEHNPEIYTMKADGSDVTRLTYSGPTQQNFRRGFDFEPAWSPDGTKIAFTSWRDIDPGGLNPEIYVMNADGTNQTNITNNVARDTHPAWSPDGTKIAFTSGREAGSGIYTMNADGSAVTFLAAFATDADWSPDGTKIAFESNRDPPRTFEIYTMDADGSAQTRLTNEPASDIDPAWSPDGTKIAFATERDDDFEIYTMDADGSAPTNISNSPGPGHPTTNQPGVDSKPDWAPLRFPFEGFFPPVENLPALNPAKAGSAIPIKFSLGGFQGLLIFDPGYPKSEQIACGSTAEVDGTESTATTGQRGLTYDSTTDRYTYVWRTSTAWAGTCRQLVVKLNDGTAHRANFRFR